MALNHANPGPQPHDSPNRPVAPNHTTTGPQNGQYSLIRVTPLTVQSLRTTIFHDGPYKTIAEVEFATAGWVDWYNHRRLHAGLAIVSPDEYEATNYAALTKEPQPA